MVVQLVYVMVVQRVDLSDIEQQRIASLYYFDDPKHILYPLYHQQYLKDNLNNY